MAKSTRDYVIQALLKKREREAAQQDKIALAQAKQVMKYQSPEQQYLRRRAAEENPMMQMMIPEANQQFEGGGAEVQFPAEKITRDKKGMLEAKPTTETEKSNLFLNKLDEMIKSGRKPHPVAFKIAEKMKARINKKLGYGSDSEYKPNSVTQKALQGLAQFQTQAEALAEVSSNETAYTLAGVDTDYIKKRIKEVLPEEFQQAEERIPGKKGFLGIGKTADIPGKPARRKKGGVWYEKRSSGWEPIK